MQLFVFSGKNQRKKKKNKSPGAATSGKAPETSTPPSEPGTTDLNSDTLAFDCYIVISWQNI